MRHLFLLLTVLLLAGGLRAAEPDAKATLKRETAKCAAAWQRGDCEAIVGFLPPRVVKLSGGRAAAVRELQDQFAQAKNLGAKRLVAKTGAPTALRDAGPWQYSLIPVTAMVEGPLVELSQQTHVLALTADRGRSWSFLVLYDVTPAHLKAWLPELGGKVVIPPTPAPKMDVAY